MSLIEDISRLDQFTARYREAVAETPKGPRCGRTTNDISSPGNATRGRMHTRLMSDPLGRDLR
jgi:hypothetical protein